MKKRNARTAICLAAIALAVAGQVPGTALAYGEVTAGKATRQETDASSIFQNWKKNTWQTAGNYDDSGKIALVPGKTDSDLNFGWYSMNKGTPAVKVWMDGRENQAKTVEGTALDINALNWQGNHYAASNRVSIEGFFQTAGTYHYQYTDDYKASNPVWSSVYDYKKGSTDSFTAILTGDPQIGASGSTDDYSSSDSSVAADTYNWDKTMAQAMKTANNASFLISAGDQINDSSATKDEDLKTRESEYAGYLYPETFRSLPIAATIGNHDTQGKDYSQHFNNPNANVYGNTAAGGDFYFNYGKVLFMSLNSNNRNQSQHRAFMKQAIASNPNATWTVVVFHSDIYGSGQPHADTDAATNRVIFAPLMDEFHVDICLTGHDHTYSRSYQIKDGNVIDYGKTNDVKDPDGTVYITTGSGSGSKYYNLLKYTPYYIAERTNAMLPSFSTMDFTDNKLTLKTYDYNGSKYADDYVIEKTGAATTFESADDAMEGAKALLSGDTSAYTDESVANVQKAYDQLNTLLNEKKTAEDPFVAKLSDNYGTEADPASGYGQVKNASDKDTTNGKPVDRFKQGLSTLLDKTIYSQIQDGNQKTDFDASNVTVSASDIEEEKNNLTDAMNGLQKKPVENAQVSDEAKNSGKTKASESEKQGAVTTPAASKTSLAKADDTSKISSVPSGRSPKTGMKENMTLALSTLGSILTAIAVFLFFGIKKGILWKK